MAGSFLTAKKKDCSLRKKMEELFETPVGVEEARGCYNMALVG